MFPKPSARDRIRTDDTRFRRAVLYPLSYSGNDVLLYTATRPVASCSRGSLRKPHGSLCKPPGRTRHQGMAGFRAGLVRTALAHGEKTPKDKPHTVQWQIARKAR